MLVFSCEGLNALPLQYCFNWSLQPHSTSLVLRSSLSLIKMGNNNYYNIRGESKKFVDFVNKIKSTYAISLKLPYVCDQFYTNKHRKFQTNRFINVVSMAICLMRVSATRSTPRR